MSWTWGDGRAPSYMRQAQGMGSPYGVMTPALAGQSAAVASRLARARVQNLASLADTEIAPVMATIPKSNAEAHFRVAYWLAVGAQLAGGRGVAWRELFDGAKEAFQTGNLKGVGLQTGDRRAAILRAGKDLAYKHGIGEAASALAQLEHGAARKRGGTLALVAGGGLVLAVLLGMLVFRRR